MIGFKTSSWPLILPWAHSQISAQHDIEAANKMASIQWESEINFASALLLHSCVTIILKETFNILEILRRVFLRRRYVRRPKTSEDPKQQIKTSIVLDAYTSIFSLDLDGELSELYFTNTGLILLATSLAASVAMNMLLSTQLLNTVVAATFGAAFMASFVNGEKELVLPIMALRRAGRFIWSDTPFVNFFSLVYIATVLHGQSSLRLQDYVTFRSIAVLELVFMKAKLAAASPDDQIGLIRKLVASEWVAMNAKSDYEYLNQPFPPAKRDDIVPFTTRQRLSVMLFKTAIGFHFGCLQGASGPATIPLPDVGCYTPKNDQDWKVFRLTEDIMILVDCLAESSPKGYWRRFIARAHGVLLRRLGKVRVIYLLRVQLPNQKGHIWHSNINLVTGVTRCWLDDNFRLSQNQGSCKVAG
ncbi:hypothetical protein GQ53DRAFT_707067 [Thozetella sp. PMI_491]|nr:hypothetical protein GQ53DRAFT_707067 [Thozetella sp. PMI_491]